jgi:hypothetical protein
MDPLIESGDSVLSVDLLGMSKHRVTTTVAGSGHHPTLDLVCWKSECKGYHAGEGAREEKSGEVAHI